MEVIENLDNDKCVEGSLRKDKKTGKIVFRAYQRQPRDRLRYKFYNSVRKDLGRRIVNVVMHRELNTAMQALEKEEILGKLKIEK